MLRCLQRVQLPLQQLCLQPVALGSLTGSGCSCCLLLGLVLRLLQGCIVLTGLRDNMWVSGETGNCMWTVPGILLVTKVAWFLRPSY